MPITVTRMQGTRTYVLALLDVLRSEVERVRQGEEFMGLLHGLVERDKEILDRLAE